MKPTLEKLWNGNLVPSDTCGEGDLELEELAELMESNRVELESMLTEAQRDLLKNIVLALRNIPIFLRYMHSAAGSPLPVSS